MTNNRSINDRQVGGDHYRATYQHWDFVYDCLGGDYLLGCFTKYLTRHRKKNGVQDLRKAAHYLDKKISTLPADLHRTARRHKFTLLVVQFCRANDLEPLETALLIGATHWVSRDGLELLREPLAALIKTIEDSTTESINGQS